MATLARHLNETAGMSKDAAQREAKRCRIVAALGRYPTNTEDFIVLWLQAHAYTMNYKGEFEGARGVPVGLDHILNELKVWTDEKGVFKGVFEPALRLWMSEERLKLVERTFHGVAFDSSIDPEMRELKRFIDLLVREEDDPEVTARNKRGALIATTNFIHRVKNHLAAYVGLRHPSGEKRWHHHTNVMPVLCGAQEDGKTLATKVMMRPVEDLTTGMGFELLADNSRENMLSYVPVMTFDELAGLKNANVEKLKGMMTEEIKSMRDAYERASPKRVITTFWGCTNKDINGLIRDETGNRRFFQIATKKVDVGEMQKIDSLKIWRSVDENAISPLYAHPEDLQIVKEIQAEQRHKSSVEDWLENCAAIPHGPDEWLSTTALFTSYVAYVQVYHPSEAKLVNLTRFGRELSRLHGCGHPQIEQRLNSKSKTNTYRITPRDQFEADGERSERVRAKVVESLKTTPPAANTNTAATTIRRDELGFPLPEEPSKVAIPTSSTGISLDAIHDALHASGGTPAIEGMMEKIMRQRRA